MVLIVVHDKFELGKAKSKIICENHKGEFGLELEWYCNGDGMGKE